VRSARVWCGRHGCPAAQHLLAASPELCGPHLVLGCCRFACTRPSCRGACGPTAHDRRRGATRARRACSVRGASVDACYWCGGLQWRCSGARW
jgi:hypothetical protein